MSIPPLLIVPIAALAQAPQQPEEKKELVSIAHEPRVRLRAGAWFTSMDGDLKAGDEIAGTTATLNFQDTLGLPSNKVSVTGSVGFDLGKDQRWHLDLGYLGHFAYDGTSGPVNISFNGLNFTGSVQSDATLDVFEITGLYDLTVNTPVTVSIGVGSRIFSFDGSITGTAFDPSTSTTSVRSERADAVVPIPGLAAALRWDITDRVYARGQVQGLYVGSYGNFFDAAAELGFDFGANIGLFAGYRWLHGEADVSDVSFNLNLRGPFAGVEVRF